MLVYGDPSYSEHLGILAARLRESVLRAAHAPAPPTLDALRTLLIEAGQVEQAARDAEADAPSDSAAGWGGLCETVTDHFALAFYHAWAAADADSHPVPNVHAALRDALNMLNLFAPAPGPRALVKLPEGYAFYALYPEQYALAARRWAAVHNGGTPRKALVVGVRSIGTGLSALVRATLAADGWQAARLTVRPTGHPYGRHAALLLPADMETRWALVVDEGPGHSGSSLASVAQALAEAGVDAARICFFPGHAGEPGAAASEAVRAWWARVPRVVASPADLRWNGQSLVNILAARTQALHADGSFSAPAQKFGGITRASAQDAGSGTLAPPDNFGGDLDTHADNFGGDLSVRTDDFGGGLWRQAVYADPALWPACCLPFERPKFRCVLPGGTSVLWAYAGLAVGRDGPQMDAALARLRARADAGWTLPPLATVLGFVATLWVDGHPLSPSDANNPHTLAHLGRYLAAVAGPPQEGADAAQAVDRLGEMLRWNVWEALGDDAAARTEPWHALAAAWEQRNCSPTYGDGRMAPHKWLRTRTGRLVKADSGGHDADHTLIGRQSVAWDIAGTIVEWGPDAGATRLLLQAYQDAGGALPPPDVLTFYELAYAAFRLGQCTLCAALLAHDPPEQVRLRAAAQCYQAHLLPLLA